MRLTELLTPERVTVHRREADAPELGKGEALTILSSLLVTGTKLASDTALRVLREREALQSTGIGDGVAIPHGALAELDHQRAALLVVPDGLDFDAIDGQKVNILFAVISPKRATGEHLKTLARISRLLRNRVFREQLLAAPDGARAFDLLESEEKEQR